MRSSYAETNSPHSLFGLYLLVAAPRTKGESRCLLGAVGPDTLAASRSGEAACSLDRSGWCQHGRRKRTGPQLHYSVARDRGDHSLEKTVRLDPRGDGASPAFHPYRLHADQRGLVGHALHLVKTMGQRSSCCRHYGIHRVHRAESEVCCQKRANEIDIRAYPLVAPIDQVLPISGGGVPPLVGGADVDRRFDAEKRFGQPGPFFYLPADMETRYKAVGEEGTRSAVPDLCRDLPAYPKRLALHGTGSYPYLLCDLYYGSWDWPLSVPGVGLGQQAEGACGPRVHGDYCWSNSGLRNNNPLGGQAHVLQPIQRIWPERHLDRTDGDLGAHYSYSHAQPDCGSRFWRLLE